MNDSSKMERTHDEYKETESGCNGPSKHTDPCDAAACDFYDPSNQRAARNGPGDQLCGHCVGQPNDQLIVYLDEILQGLKFGGKYELVSLKDEAYQSDLDAQMEY